MSISVITIAALLLLFECVLCTLRRVPYRKRTLIIGTTPLARLIVNEMASRPGGLQLIAGVVHDVKGEIEPPFTNLLVGSVGRLSDIIEKIRPDRIVVALSDRRGRLPVRELLQARVQGVAVEDGVRFYEQLTGKIAIEALTPHDLISSPAFRKSHVNLAFGHALSLAVSVVALVVLAPVFALVALAIKLDSPGPVFFVQYRVGLRGRPFRLLKFRTMRPAEQSASEWVRDNGDRITRVGRVLRRHRLDELPQLVNVLRGELNLVGPRPHPLCNFDLFTQKIPYYWLRAAVRPGLTGWAQVRQGYANSLEEETEKMRHDLYYIKHMSAWLDLRILMNTLRIVFAGHGASGVVANVRPVLRTPFIGGFRLATVRARAASSGFPLSEG
jgi:exopolysaccharide biosynthesis polyprenyl glycosylphosphotransferase